MRGPSFEYSIESSRNWFWRAMTSASDRRRLISSNRSSNFSSLRRMESFIAADYSGIDSMPVAFRAQDPGQGFGQGRISLFGGPSQRLRRRVQQPVGQSIGQVLHYLIGG